MYLQLKISFDDHATTTFEYEGEESALQNYLMEHPDEKEEALKQVRICKTARYFDFVHVFIKNNNLGWL